MIPEIINYNPKYARAFYELNIEWLQTYFYVEPYDNAVLSNPKVYIIDKGGFIFFAKINETIVGTVALMPTDKIGVLELTKMAVLTSVRGQKIGQQLVQHCIDFARTKNIESLLLYSNRKLENAIFIYCKYGFKELELETDNPYERADIKMQLILQ
jgi:ribosomal protein S18 acetylase RimI-like enzyme